MDKLRRTFTGSATGALLGLLMIGAIAFGSTVVRPMTADRTSDTAAAQNEAAPSAGTDGDGSQPSGNKVDGFTPAFETSGGTDAEAADSEQGSEQEPPHEQSKPPADEPKDEPKSEPPAPPKSEPVSTKLKLDAVFNADKGQVVVEWSAYAGDFEKYKLVRSKDSNPTWPLGDGDTLAAVVGPDGARRFVDGDAPCGVELHYRAFAVRHSGDGYVILASSNVDGVVRPCDAPPPDPVAMSVSAEQAADGVKLSWAGCGSDAFAAYKVVRSATNANPMYPLNDGTELIGVVENQSTTMFTDPNVEPGQAWTYRVLCMGHNGSGWYVLGMTDAVAVTVS
jgi:hypothetical protein